jgi:integrase
MLKKFMRWERRADVKPITLAKDFVTIRLILRHAVEEGWLTALPVFPRVGKLDANPRPWLEPEQWKKLQEEAEERIEIAKDEPGKHRHSRQDLLDFMRLQVATCMRVDELRAVRVRDVQIKKSSRITYGGKTLPPGVAQLAKNLKPDSNEYLEIQVNGKTGQRVTVTRRACSGVEQFRSVEKRKNLKPEDLLFEEHHRDAFRELLLFAKLRDNNGTTRNLKALRCTGIMLWVLAEPNANLKLLASNFGTSVQMLDQFYLKPLNVEMRREELVG